MGEALNALEARSAKEIIARRTALELKDGMVVNLGIGLPTLIPQYLPADIRVTIQSENGVIGLNKAPEGAQHSYVTDASGKRAAVSSGGAFIDSVTSFGLIRGGHVDVTILGSLQVDQEGSLANWMIPGKKTPGMGGAMDLLVGVRQVIVAMEHTARGVPKIMKKCTLPLTAVHCVTKIITEMCVFDVTDAGLVMTELNPQYTIAEVQAVTEADFTISDYLTEMKIA